MLGPSRSYIAAGMPGPSFAMLGKGASIPLRFQRAGSRSSPVDYTPSTQ